MRITRMMVVTLLAATLMIAASSVPVSAADTDPLVEVQFWMDGEAGNGFLLVTGTLPPDTSLPATLTLPVPDGASLTWAGELSGSGPESDIQRQVVMEQTDTGVLMSISLETTLTGQYDAVYLPTQVSGTTREAVLTWTHGIPASRVLFSVVLPAGADEMDFDPVPISGPASNRAGESLYVLPDVEDPEVGSETVLFMSYVPGSLLGDRSSDSTGTTLLVLGAVAAVLGLALVLVLRSQNRNRPVSDSTEHEG